MQQRLADHKLLKSKIISIEEQLDELIENQHQDMINDINVLGSVVHLDNQKKGRRQLVSFQIFMMLINFVTQKSIAYNTVA
ncbi:hypothetical protein RAS_00180 [Rickettsia asiatica]|uniref:t-SNARE coiled-coil homology domain-containing protein n=1 Tax=Rickettsia asiatica TaxID=238800 RepID=A0A510GAP8_9RICK|nr:hypothetical protein [Rickettsia asiatica]BBJ30909.1 hypothetical protein RAS_00180 [Rickettsia asiatica]